MFIGTVIRVIDIRCRVRRAVGLRSAPQPSTDRPHDLSLSHATADRM